MSIRKPFISGEYYHIYNRGTNKMQIFNNQNDYFRFQKLLYLSNNKKNIKYSTIEIGQELNKLFTTNTQGNPEQLAQGGAGYLSWPWLIEKEESLVDIISYCLMPNHFHILIKVKNEKDSSKFILKLLTSYSMYFNKKYDRTGTLFEGKTKSKHVISDIQLKYLLSYIHLNPAKIIDSDWKNKKIKDNIKIINFLKEYKFSSLIDYLGTKREENKILNKKVFPEYFKNPKEHLEEISEWLNYNNEEI